MQLLKYIVMYMLVDVNADDALEGARRGYLNIFDVQ
jgi:hypothetical protein